MSNKGGKKLVVTSATAVALALPLAFASPSVAIARAYGAVNTVSVQRKGAAKPDMSKIDDAKKSFDSAYKGYQDEKKAYDKVVADNLTGKDTKALEASHQAQLDALNAELNPMIDNINKINADINKVNTDNQEKLQSMIREFEELKKQVEDANKKMAASQARIDENLASYEKRHALALKSVEEASEALKAKEAEFNAFKTTYENDVPKYVAQKKNYDEKLSAIKAQIAELEEQIAKLPKNSEAGYKEAGQKAASIQTQIDALKDEKVALEAEFKTINASYTELRAKYDALDGEYEHAKAQLSATNADLNELADQIKADKAQLDAEYKASKTAYEQAVAKKDAFEVEVDRQKKLAEAENKKNAQIYADAEAKFNAYNQKVVEFNKQRDNLSTDIQDAKKNIEDAFNKLKTSFDAAKKAQDALAGAHEAYNQDVDAYNASLKADFDVKQDKYNKDMKAYQEALDKMKENIHKDGQLSEVVVQSLHWGAPTDTKAETYMNDGSIKWSNPNNVKPGTYFGFNHEPIKGHHNGWIGNLVKAGKSATVTYKQSALNGLVAAGKPVKELKITYTNESKFDQYILASVNPQYGFWVRYPDPKNPKKLLGGPAALDKDTFVFLSTNVKMQFIGEDGKAISFSKDKPANIYLSSLNNGTTAAGPNHVENISYNNFDRLIPINKSWVRTDVILPLHDGPVIAVPKATPKNSTWDNISNPNFYIGAICGSKTSGDTISFTASVYGNRPGGLNPWTAFYDNSTSIPLPPVPVPPTKPDYLQEEKYTPENLVEPTPDTVKPYAPKHLDPHSPMPNLLKVNDPNLQIGPAPASPNEPKHLPKLPKGADMPELDKLDVEAPQTPEALPEIPQVPNEPNVPKTADATVSGLSGILAMLGSAAVALSFKKKNN